jgi:hypothetical protein
MVMLFIAEPLVIHRRLKSSTDAEDFARMERLHRLLLAFAVVTVLGAVAGSYGVF